jgi:signal transduction histidine kinase
MSTELKILLIEDSEDDAELILEALRSCDLNPQIRSTDIPEVIKKELQTNAWDVVLCDYSMPKITATEALSLLKDTGKDIPFIVVSGAVGEATAVELMKAGVHDYIMKDRLARLGPAIEKEIRDAKNREVRRSAEEELKRWAEEMARSNEDLQRFAYVTSHDLSEPLRMVSLHVQSLREELGDQLHASAQESIDYAIEGTQRMKSLIEDLLSYSRIQMTDLAFRSVDCNAVFQQALANLDSSIQSKQAKIKCDRLPTVYVDAVPMLQVFQNLLSNALKFHPPNQAPIIEISTSKVEGKGWLFQVKDNGIGIESQYFDRIFTVFQRLHTREKFPGNGIGLSVCKKIIERFGGEIWVESKHGEGSVFMFTLPEHPGEKFPRFKIA